MKDSDEMVDRVLAGLREVEAPAGLERRVLAAMEERAVTRVGWLPMRWVLACAVVAVGVAGAFILRPAPVRVEKVAAVAVPKMQPVRGERVQKRNTEIRTGTALPTGPHISSNRTAFRVAQNDLRPRTVRAAATVREEAGGFPAPPMPLTDAEKLLLRVAHRADATELTPLNAEARERQSAEFDQEFIEFFAVPLTVTEQQQTDPTESDKGATQ